jgi:hypothetical protein
MRRILSWCLEQNERQHVLLLSALDLMGSVGPSKRIGGESPRSLKG